MQKQYTIASFFTGVGGLDKGFENTSGFTTIYANEIDPFPAQVFEENFQLPVDTRSIADIEPEEIPNFDICLGGFPCQAFSIAGYRQGFKDEKGRGNLFFELARIIEAKTPQVVVLENVKNLVTHDNGKTFTIILDTLKTLGYHTKYQVLNTATHGNVPQNRERIYIVGFRNHATYENFTFPDRIPLTTTLHDIIDFNSRIDEKYYYTPGKFKGDIYEKLAEAIDDENAVYQWRRGYVRKNKSGVIPTLTANQGTGGHNVCIVKTKHGIRKMTPRECFNTQGFDPSFILPDGMADSRLYKQAGNSVSVPVVERIAEKVADALASTDKAPQSNGKLDTETVS